MVGKLPRRAEAFKLVEVEIARDGLAPVLGDVGGWDSTLQDQKEAGRDRWLTPRCCATCEPRDGAYIAIMVTGYCLWDRYGTVNGRLVPLTVPAKVRIDAAGYAVSATGRVLTDHNGRPSRSTTHPKAVQRLGL